MNKRVVILSLLVIALGAVGAVYWQRIQSVAPTASTQSPDSSQDTEQTAEPAGFNKQLFSISDPTSVWVVVNKLRALNPASYQPTDLVFPDVPLRVPGQETMRLRQETATALEKMFAAAKADGINLMLSSGQRDFQYQTNLYNSYVSQSGQTEADKFSARPSHSEHQTGLAADIEPTSRKCELDICFGELPEGKWLAANAYKFGFIIRYTADKVSTTGYMYEPWHVRYVGVDLSTEMHNQSIATLEEFFELSPAPDYQ